MSLYHSMNQCFLLVAIRKSTQSQFLSSLIMDEGHAMMKMQKLPGDDEIATMVQENRKERCRGDSWDEKVEDGE